MKPLKTPWFRPKAAPSWGFAPYAWQGWALTFACVLAAILLVFLLRAYVGRRAVLGAVPPFVILFAVAARAGAQEGWRSLQRKAD